MNLFESYSGGNYRLQANAAEAINVGENIATDLNNNIVDLFDYTDMDFTARIKDCTVDAGAYEYDNTENIAPDASRIYYVTEVWAGLANGSSPDNAACEMKLQAVLTHAGQQAATTGQTYTVRVAEGSYEANTLSDPNDPQSYTYEIPRGVTLEGGWDEDFTVRKPLEQITKLIPQGSEGGQTVTGYHAMSFPDGGSTTAQAICAHQSGFLIRTIQLIFIDFPS